MSEEQLVIGQGKTFTNSFFWREDNGITVIVIPATYQARLRFAKRFDSAASEISLTSSPAAGLTLNRALGQIDARISALVTANLNANVPLVWELEIYDPADTTTVLLLGNGKASVTPRVP